MLNVRRKQGDNAPIELSLKDSNGVPYDLTGATLSASIKNRLGVDVAQLSVISPSPTDGRITVETGDTSSWDVGKHEWDVRVEFESGRVFVIPSDGVATWEVIKSITR